MAQTYKSKSGDHYIALSNMEKRYIYKMACNIIKDVSERTLNGTLPKRWNDIDIDALEIMLICAPLENNGRFDDLMVVQIHKLDKALKKLYSTTFQDLFEIEIDGDNLLSVNAVYCRMEAHREHKRKVEQQKIINSKDDLLKQSGLFY